MTKTYCLLALRAEGAVHFHTQVLADGHSCTHCHEKSGMKYPVLGFLSSTKPHLSASPLDESSIAFRGDMVWHT